MTCYTFSQFMVTVAPSENKQKQKVIIFNISEINKALKCENKKNKQKK